MQRPLVSRQSLHTVVKQRHGAMERHELDRRAEDLAARDPMLRCAPAKTGPAT